MPDEPSGPIDEVTAGCFHPHLRDSPAQSSGGFTLWESRENRELA